MGADMTRTDMLNKETGLKKDTLIGETTVQMLVYVCADLKIAERKQPRAERMKQKSTWNGLEWIER